MLESDDGEGDDYILLLNILVLFLSGEGRDAPVGRRRARPGEGARAASDECRDAGDCWLSPTRLYTNGCSRSSRRP